VKAAVLHTYRQVPRYEEFPDPTPGEGEVLVRVRAASLKNVDRDMASGTHYDSSRDLPLVVGVDGVGVLDDGTRVYCGGARRPYGMMAERTVVSRAWCFPVPDGIDDITAAALPNPALSSYLPLVWRAQLQPNETVLILGATGVAGQLAVQIAKHLGAGRVVAAGRNAEVLRRLPVRGADLTIKLEQSDADLAVAFAQAAHQRPFDVILDYVWGRPAEVLLGALTGHDVLGEPHRMRYVQIGNMAGPTIALPAEALRSTGLELYGGGGGSIPRTAISEAVPRIMALASNGSLTIETERVPLSSIESAWQQRETQGRRIVIVP
jgi:NADPH:quinone reductase-like Zn-dependent oxidoreductase